MKLHPFVRRPGLKHTTSWVVSSCLILGLFAGCGGGESFFSDKNNNKTGKSDMFMLGNNMNMRDMGTSSNNTRDMNMSNNTFNNMFISNDPICVQACTNIARCDDTTTAQECGSACGSLDQPTLNCLAAQTSACDKIGDCYFLDVPDMSSNNNNNNNMNQDMGSMEELYPEIPATEEATSDTRFNSLKGFLNSYLMSNSIPGAGVVIVERRKVRHIGSLGVRNTTNMDAMTDTSRHALNACTKVITAAAAVKMAKNGTLDINQPANQIFTDFKIEPASAQGNLNAYSLLTNTSCYPSFPNAYFNDFMADYNAPDALQAFFRKHTVPLPCLPGEMWRDSKFGFSALALLMEQKAGKPFAQVVKDEILTPYGMSNSTFDSSMVKSGEYVVSHADDGAGLMANDYDFDKIQQPYSGLFVTLDDMGKFMVELTRSRDQSHDLHSLSKALLDTKLPPDTRTSLGLFVQDYLGMDVLYYLGQSWGYSSLMVVIPEAGFGATMIFNRDRLPLTELLQQLLGLYVGPPEMPSVTPHEELHRYVGIYSHPSIGEVGVGIVDNKLEMRFNRIDTKIFLEHMTSDTFEVTVPVALDPIAPADYTTIGSFWTDGSNAFKYFSFPLGILTRE